jgi:hypothetical protein
MSDIFEKAQALIEEIAQAFEEALMEGVERSVQSAVDEFTDGNISELMAEADTEREEMVQEDTEETGDFVDGFFVDDGTCFAQHNMERLQVFKNITNPYHDLWEGRVLFHSD